MSSLQGLLRLGWRPAIPSKMLLLWRSLLPQVTLWLPSVSLLLATTICLLAWFYRIDTIEEAQMTASNVAATRALLLKQRSQGPFPLSSQRRAMAAKPDYLHEVVERMPLRRSELQRVLALEADEHLSKLPSIQLLQRTARESPPTLNLISKPANQGKVFVDRLYHLSKPVEVDLADVAQLLVFIEGANSSKTSPPDGRPLLTITEFRLEESRQPEGRWLLDMHLLEREWRRARAH